MFVIVKAAVFVLGGSQYLRVCQHPSLSKKVGSQQVPTCKLAAGGKVCSQTLPRRNWELGIFACSFCAEPGYTATGVLTAPI